MGEAEKKYQMHFTWLCNEHHLPIMILQMSFMDLKLTEQLQKI